MGKMVFDERNGYSYISENGIKYDLLEGMSYQGKSTSDILFIMLAYETDFFETMDIYASNELVGWFMGASTYMPESEEIVSLVDEIVRAYEKKHPEYVEYYKNKKQNKVDRILDFVNYYSFPSKSGSVVTVEDLKKILIDTLVKEN